MKRILLLFSAIMLSCIALWAHDVVIDGIYYNLDETNKTAEVTYRGDYNDSYNEYSGSVTIPETITYNSEIYSVTSIGNAAFYGCSGLTEITIPNSVTSIGDWVFEDCSGLTSVIWNVKNCEDPIFTFTAFSDISSSITSFTFGNEVEHIPANLCYEMNNLKEVTIGKSVTSIGGGAFYGCSGLKKVNYLGTVDKWVEIDFDYDYSNSNPTCYAKDLYINNELLTDVKITTADSIKNYAFYNCQSIKSVEIGKCVTSIGGSSFNGCSGLTSVTIPNSVTYIGEDTFYNTGIYNNNSNWDNGVLYIDNCLIQAKSDVVKGSYTIKEGTRIIGSAAFMGCKELTSITIPNSVTSIGSSAFYDCSGLTSVTIPNSVTFIDYYTFYGCSGLTSVTIPNSVTSIGALAFYNTGIYNNNSNWDNGVLYIDNCLIQAKSDVVKGSYTIKKGTRIIGSAAFMDCKELTSVTIPNSATSIGDVAFYGCSGLTSVTIPNSVTSIGSSAFYDCSGLTSVTIPNSVTFIGSSAFSGCQNLKTVYNSSLLEIVKGSSDNGYVAYYAEEVINASVIGDLIVDDHGVIIKYIGDANIEEIIIPEYIKGIDEGVFSECSKIKKVISYPTIVPSTYNNSFANYNAYLYVPCDVFEDYDLDDVFGNFKYIKCIAAEEVDAPEKVEIEVDEDNNANVIWPSTDGAKKYELEISKDGEVFCTLLFNENGQLTSIDFGNRSASVGFQFTVTGLDGASKYAYSMVAMDKKGNELQSYKGTFTTNGYVPGPGEEDDPSAIIETLADANITVSGGTISADADFSIYNAIGQDVTAFNGSLQPGIYVVALGKDRVKVMIK